jgi:hypothetical protein
MSCPIRPRTRPENPPGCPPDVVPSVGDSSTIIGDPILRDMPPTQGETALITKYHPLYVYLVDLFAHGSASDVYYGEAAILHDVQGGPWWPPGVPMTPATGYRIGLTQLDYLAIVGLATTSSYWDDIDPERMNLALMWAIRQHFINQYHVDLARFHVEIRSGVPYRLADPAYPTRQAIVLRELQLHCSERECFIPGEIDPENDYRYYVADQLIASLLRHFTDTQVGVTNWGRRCEWAGEFQPSLARGYLHNGYALVNVAQTGWVLHLGPTLFDKLLRNFVGLPDPDPAASDPLATPPVDPTDTPPPNYHAAWTNFAHFGLDAMTSWLRQWAEHHTGLREDSGTLLRTAERFDYGTTQLTATPHNPTEPRLYHTATWTNAGNLVLVAGGWGAGHIKKTAEFYSVGFGLWTPTASMFQARALHTATKLQLLPDQILVVGGIDDNDTPLAGAEKFDTVAHTWSSAGAMAHVRMRHTATYLSNLGANKVVVVGGWGGISGGLAATDCSQSFDITTLTWDAPVQLNQGRAHHGATETASARMFVCGGFGPDGTVLNSTEEYTVAGGWAVKASMPHARRDHTLTEISGPGPATYLLAVGGYGPGGVVLQTADLYRVNTNFWNGIVPSPMTYRRALHSAARISDTKVLVYGGVDELGNPVANAEIYDAVANTWTVVPQITARKGARAVSLGLTGGGGTVDVLLAGGDDAAAGPLSKKLHWALQSGGGDLNAVRGLYAVKVRPQDDWSCSGDVATVLREYQHQLCAHAVVDYHIKWVRRWAWASGGPTGDQGYVDGRTINYGGGVVKLLDAIAPGGPPVFPLEPTAPLPNPWFYMPSQLIHRHVWAPDLRRWDFNHNLMWSPTIGQSKYFLMCPWVFNWTDWFKLKQGCDVSTTWATALVQKPVESDVLDLLITNRGQGVSTQPWPPWRQMLNAYGGTYSVPPPWATIKEYLDTESYQLLDRSPTSTPPATARNTPPPDPLWTYPASLGGAATFTLKERDILLAVFEQYLADSPTTNFGVPADPTTVVWLNKVGNYSKYPDWGNNASSILDWSQTAITRATADVIIALALDDPLYQNNSPQAMHAAIWTVLAPAYRLGILKDDGAAPPPNTYTYDNKVDYGINTVFDNYWRYWGKEVSPGPPPDPQADGGMFRDIAPVIEPTIARFHSDLWQSSLDIDVTLGNRVKPDPDQYIHSMMTRVLFYYLNVRGY